MDKLIQLLFNGIVYIILVKLLPDSKIPLLILAYSIGKMFNVGSYQNFKLKIRSTLTKSVSTVSSDFRHLPHNTKIEIVSTIKSLQLYSANNKKFIDQKRKSFKLMSWRQQKLCEDVGYLDKLNTIESLIGQNQKVLNKVVDFTMSTYDLRFSDFDLIKNITDNSSFKVIEGLSHFSRDWNQVSMPEELQPIYDYIINSIKALDSINLDKTTIIMPGSGLGRIPHELSKQGYHVNSIELNGLMYLFNKFIYANDVSGLEIYPYIHLLSNFTTLKNQFRSVMLPSVSKPQTLNIWLEDFKFFESPTNFDSIVVVTVFFIDTAENLVDYLDTINELVKGYKSKYWINIGPLKYGTAPQVELNAEELKLLREKMGWQDLQNYNSLETHKLFPYVTDKQSLWQGYYGVVGWCCRKL